MERFAIKIDKKLKANLYKICRLCGMDNPDMVPILTDNQANDGENFSVDVDAEMELSQKINLLIGLSVTKDDKMPQTMCGLCVDKINDFYEFREMCYATNAQTRKLLGLKNIKKPIIDIKPKVEIKEESIVPTPITNKNGNRKRKSDELIFKEDGSSTLVVYPKKKSKFCASIESGEKEEVPMVAKKKLRFSLLNDESMSVSTTANNKKSKLSLIEDTKPKKEESPPILGSASAIYNKKFRLPGTPQKEIGNKKSKQKGSKFEQREYDVKEEIKEEIKEELAPITMMPHGYATLPLEPSASKLKFGCCVCNERFAAKVKLENHIRAMHSPKIERYVCTACNEVLSKSFDIKNHQLWHKLSKTPYVCGCCGESILNTYAFSRHLREHAFETPPALLVLDRECPQCHTSYATNFLYNIHSCAVKTKRCAGCNRLQRNEAEYLKHSALCAKVYLNYSKHIMPSVEALEDAVRIKNENDVEAAAEEMARLSGVSLDMAPVVQLTRLSSPLIMAANQCASVPGFDDAASTSSKKSGKKGVSKKDLKRVDELLKSTLDALVSIKHEPEIHMEEETPCSDNHSDNDDLDEEGDFHFNDDEFHHDDDYDSADEDDCNSAGTKAKIVATDIPTGTGSDQIKIKQEIDEVNEENLNKIGGGLKLKIKKEHGQLNSSIIEQQKFTEKRAEKRKKKKKHKDKEKDRQKLPKDLQEEQMSQDSNTNNNYEETISSSIRIKTEPQDGTDASDIPMLATAQMTPQLETTNMTYTPVMQFQIACVSSGVEFNNSVTAATAVESQHTLSSLNRGMDLEDVKPNREELDRMLKISHVSSGIAMETDENEETEKQPTDDHCGNDERNVDDYHEDNFEGDNQDNSNEYELYDEKHSGEGRPDREDEFDRNTDMKKTSEEIIAKKIKKPFIKTKPNLTLQPTETPQNITNTALSRNKACKSTAKPPTMPVIQISAVQSGVNLEPTTNRAVDIGYTSVFIKSEPQNRGYADELCPQLSEMETPKETEESSAIHNTEEQDYISSIDFNNITIKQEKDIEINDVQICHKSARFYEDLNGIKRKRKQIRRTHINNDKSEEGEEDMENNAENSDYDEENEESDENAYEYEEDYEEEAEEEEDLEEEEEDEEDNDVEEEREYRELEYPPELVERKVEGESEAANKDNKTIEKVCLETKKDLSNENEAHINETGEQMKKGIENNSENEQHVDSNASVISPSTRNSSFFKASDVELTTATSLNDTNKTLITESSCSGLSNVVDCTDLNTTAPNKTNVSNTQTLKASLPMNKLQENSNERELSLEICQSVEAQQSGHTMETMDFKQESNVADTALIEKSLIKECSKQRKYQEEYQHLGLITQNRLNVYHEDKNLENAQEFKSKSQKMFESNVPQNVEEYITSSQEPDLSKHHELELDAQDQQIRKSDQVILHSKRKIQMTDQQVSRRSQGFEKIVGKHHFPYLKPNSQQLDETEHPANQNSLLYSSPYASTANEYERNSKQLLQTTKNAGQNVMQNDPELESQTSQVSKIKLKSVIHDSIQEYNTSVSNNNDKKIVKDNHDELATIAGVVEQSKELNLEAQPILNTKQSIQNVDDVGEDEENDVEEDEVIDDDSALDNNLEEQQNYQNQEVLSQIRPSALALHPYLEDISSSSNSMLSNSLSQTPPPSQSVLHTPATCLDTLNTRTQDQQQSQQQECQQLNEETENILNESNDISRRSRVEVTRLLAAGQPLPQPQAHLPQQLPPHMPTFNFDNINEIAENNNNANIEREHLQDEQQQQQTSNNVT